MKESQKYTGLIKAVICLLIFLAGEIASIWCYQKGLNEIIFIVWVVAVCFINFTAKYRVTI